MNINVRGHVQSYTFKNTFNSISMYIWTDMEVGLDTTNYSMIKIINQLHLSGGYDKE
jgi:hypothetical protein